MILRLQDDDRLHHGEWRRIGRGLRAARLAHDGEYFRELLDDAVLHLHQLLCLGDRDPGHRRRHVKQSALIERRHEFGPELLVDRNRDHDYRNRPGNHKVFPAQRPAADGVVEPHQDPADGVILFRMDLADQDRIHNTGQPQRPELEVVHMREQQSHRRVQRDSQHRGNDHGEVLGVGQRLEKAAFLSLQGQHGQERNGDHQQCKEARSADFLHGIDDHPVVVFLSSGPLPFFEVLVGLLHHHDGRIHHGADGNRNAAERHDIGADAHHLHRNERDDNSDGNREYRDDRTGNVPQEDEDHQRHNHHFLGERPFQVCDGTENQVGTVVRGDDLYARRQPGFQILDLRLDSLDRIERVLALPHHDDARDHVALAVPIGDASPDVGTEDDRANILYTNGHATLCVQQDNVTDIVNALNIAVAPYHVLRATELDKPAADIAIAITNRLNDFHDRYFV